MRRVSDITIEEAIAHEKEVAKEIYVEAMLCHANPDDGKLDDCIERGKYHEHLAEWLEELKDYMDKNKMVVRIDCVNSEEFNDIAVKLAKEQYNKAIDDFVKAIVDRGLSSNDDKYCITSYDNYLKVIKEMAEQLKEGGNNE